MLDFILGVLVGSVIGMFLTALLSANGDRQEECMQCDYRKLAGVPTTEEGEQNEKQ